MPRKSKSVSVSKDLLKFHTSTTPELPSTTRNHGLHHGSHRSNNSRGRVSKKQWQAQQKERQARKELNSSFFLHSSSSHSFVIKRCQRHNGDSYVGEQLLDADSVVSWDNVLLVKNFVPANLSDQAADSSTSTCSICLGEFVSPRVTPCGHIYCYSCILQHLYSSGKEIINHNPAAKCPCCSSLFQRSDLRPVAFISVMAPKPQSSMTFQKIHRTGECFVPFVPTPRTTANTQVLSQIQIRRGVGPDVIPSMNDVDAPFCRYNYVDMFSFLTHLQHDISCLQRELDDLNKLYQNYKNTTTFDCVSQYIKVALQAVETEYEINAVELEQEMELQQRYEKEQMRFWVDAMPIASLEDTHVKTGEEPSFQLESKEMSDNGKAAKATKNNLKMSPKSKKYSPGTSYLHDDCIHLYQSSDGQLCFLSAFNMKCLSSDFTMTLPVVGEGIHQPANSLLPYPDTVSGTVIEVENIHVTPDERKRRPFLKHVPLYSDVSFVEIDLNSMLSKSTKDLFRSEMERRRKKRQAKRNREKKATKVQAKNEAKRIEMVYKRTNENSLTGAVDSFEQSAADEVEEWAQLSCDVSSSKPTPQTPSSDSYLSFRSVCASNGYFPPLGKE